MGVQGERESSTLPHGVPRGEGALAPWSWGCRGSRNAPLTCLRGAASARQAGDTTATRCAGSGRHARSWGRGSGGARRLPVFVGGGGAGGDAKVPPIPQGVSNRGRHASLWQDGVYYARALARVVQHTSCARPETTPRPKPRRSNAFLRALSLWKARSFRPDACSSTFEGNHDASERRARVRKGQRRRGRD
jgi:hypothetical protein